MRFPRAPIDIKLAVLLLRSTYETVDALDMMAMDTFQINFWKSRQSEWEPYTQQYSPLKIEQGKLTDPLYFDFISYTQFKVVAKEIPRSQSVFEERSGAEGTTKVIRRDAACRTISSSPRCWRSVWGTRRTPGCGTGSRAPTLTFRNPRSGATWTRRR